jgi:C-terminal peptidase prc
MKKRFVLLLIALNLIFLPAFAQNLKSEKILHQNILKTIKKDIEEKYYDSKFHGVDIDENVKKTSELIEKANSSEEMTDMIARFLYLFDDSHLYFMPPRKTVTVEYGWELRLIGDGAFVVKLDEKSDAYKKGVRVGDQIYMIDGYIINRPEFSMVRYHFEVLRPQSKLNILLIKPNGNKYKTDIEAKVTKESVFMPSTRDLKLESEKNREERTHISYYDKIDGLTIVKLPSFSLSKIQVEKLIGKIEDAKALIVDLRGNGGGYVDSLNRFAGNFFDKEIDVGKIIKKKGTYKFVVEPKKGKTYSGSLVVLIDSESASASEIFAKIVQMEKRGVVLGDQSAGAVMQSIVNYHEFGLDSLIPYGVSVTVADLVMKDGIRLEKNGVIPDEQILPTAADLAIGNDPVISRAVQKLGFQMTAEEAGKIFAKD